MTSKAVVRAALDFAEAEPVVHFGVARCRKREYSVEKLVGWSVDAPSVEHFSAIAPLVRIVSRNSEGFFPPWIFSTG
jgi:hypothetical protein